MESKALVLHSGGLDSTVCLRLAQSSAIEVLSFGIDYGQKHIIEHQYALNQCAKFSVVRQVLDVKWQKPTLSIPNNRSIEQMRTSISPAFLPGRNAVFLCLACAEAAGRNFNEVWIGVNAIDFSGYPDCRPDFIKAFEQMILEAIPNGPKIVAPLLSLTKAEIARKARGLGISQGETWSCYRPQITRSGVEPCHLCDACILHDHAWKEVTSNTAV
jgi:7-cyano-7-deazaguanine synthase